MIIKKPCINCSILYETSEWSNSMYCSDKCGKQFRRKHGNSIRLKQIKKICEICAKTFYAPPQSPNKELYCSRKCSDKTLSVKFSKPRVRRVQFTCQTCAKEFTDKWYKFRKYCSHKCYAKSLKGVAKK